jgi:polyhydroxyalkanoate synthesis regulator phasin
MPVVEQEAHIQSAKDKDLRLDCKVAFQDQAFLEEYHQHVKDARLLHRLQMGRTWANALDQADRGQGLAKQLAQDIDKDTSYIYQHTRAWNAVKDSFQPQPQKEGFPWDKFERPSGKMALQREVESEAWAYVYDCEDEERNKSLSALNRWVSEDYNDSGGNEEIQQRSEVDERISRVEDLKRKLDSEVSALENLAREGQVPERLQEAAESVTVAAKEEVGDTVERLARLPDAAPERVEDEEYLEWLRQRHACVACGIEGEGMTAHHLREYVKEVGIAMTVDDYKTLPLCPSCHRELEDMPSITFWEEGTAVSDPPALADELAAQFLRLVRTDSHA